MSICHILLLTDSVIAETQLIPALVFPSVPPQNASPAQETGAQQHHRSVLHDSEQARGSFKSHVLGAEEESAPWCRSVPAESFSERRVGDAGRRVG